MGAALRAAVLPAGIVTGTAPPAGRVPYSGCMSLLSYRRHRFPPPLIEHAIWLYLRFTLTRMASLDQLPPARITPLIQLWLGVLRAYLVVAGGLVVGRVIQLALFANS